MGRPTYLLPMTKPVKNGSTLRTELLGGFVQDGESPGFWFEAKLSVPSSVGWGLLNQSYLGWSDGLTRLSRFPLHAPLSKLKSLSKSLLNISTSLGNEKGEAKLHGCEPLSNLGIVHRLLPILLIFFKGNP